MMILKKSSPIKHGKLIAMVVTLMTAMTFALIYQDTQSPPHEDDYVVGVFSDNSQKHSEIESRYELLRNSILDTSDEESVRNSIDWFFQNSHQEIAVLLSSEVLRYKGHGQQDADGARTIQTLAQWLLDHKDDDNDGIYGWGLIRSTRTFGREATNPAFHEYAIEIVQVLEALMNAADTNALSQKTKDEIRELAVELAVQWSTQYWSQNPDGGGFYWYSTAETDAIECVNISSIMAGIFSRVLSECGSSFSESEYVTVLDRINRTMYAVIAGAHQKDDVIFWGYSTQSKQINDVVHVGFIIEGMENYRRYINQVSIPWNSEELLSLLTRCYDRNAGVLLDYPPQLNLEYQVEARLFSCGEILLLLEDTNDSLSQGVISFIDKKYQCWDKQIGGYVDPTIYGYSTSELAFVLRGLASYLFA